MLDVGVARPVLGADVLERVFIRSLRPTQEGGAVVRAEPRLPTLAEVLTRFADAVLFGDERLIEADEVAYRSAHPDGIPPGLVELDAQVRQVAGQEEEPVRRLRVTGAARPVEVHQQGCQAGGPGAGREDLGAIDEIATPDLSHVGAEAGGLAWDPRLRLAAPGGPDLAALDDPVEPAVLLPGVAQGGEQHLRVDVPLPAAGEGHVGLSQLLGDHPEREEAGVGAQPVAP